MSERQEHRQRLNARIAYAAAIERWEKNQPSRIAEEGGFLCG